MDYAARYRELLLALRLRVEACGYTLQLLQAPEEDGYPFELSFSNAEPDQPPDSLLLFPTAEVYLNSMLLARVARVVARTERSGGRAVLMFNERSLAGIGNALHASGLDKHAEVACYRTNNPLETGNYHAPRVAVQWAPQPRSSEPLPPTSHTAASA